MKVMENGDKENVIKWASFFKVAVELKNEGLARVDWF